MSDDLRDSLMLGRAIGQAEADYRLLRWQRTTAAVATVLCAAAALLDPIFLDGRGGGRRAGVGSLPSTGPDAAGVLALGRSGLVVRRAWPADRRAGARARRRGDGWTVREHPRRDAATPTHARKEAPDEAR